MLGENGINNKEGETMQKPQYLNFEHLRGFLEQIGEQVDAELKMDLNLNDEAREAITKTRKDLYSYLGVVNPPVGVLLGLFREFTAHTYQQIQPAENAIADLERLTNEFYEIKKLIIRNKKQTDAAYGETNLKS